MRQIEKDMVRAIRNGKSWKCDNTEVRCNGPFFTVLLHDNLIAERTRTGTRWTLAGWNTPTTRSRINALSEVIGGNGVHTKQGQAYTGNIAIADDEWVEV